LSTMAMFMGTFISLERVSAAESAMRAPSSVRVGIDFVDILEVVKTRLMLSL
jgi:hypothetical protein